MMDVKYPDIHVRLTGRDSNAMNLIGPVMTALRRAKVSPEEVQAFVNEATSGDYDNVLQTCMKWVDIS